MRLSWRLPQPSRLTVLPRVAFRTLYSGGSEARAGAQPAAAGGGAGSSSGAGPSGSTATQPPAPAPSGGSGGNGASAASALAGEEQHSHVFRKGARTVFEMPVIKDTIELTEEEAALFKELLDASRAVRGACAGCCVLGARCHVRAVCCVLGAARAARCAVCWCAAAAPRLLPCGAARPRPLPRPHCPCRLLLAPQADLSTTLRCAGGWVRDKLMGRTSLVGAGAPGRVGCGMARLPRPCLLRPECAALLPLRCRCAAVAAVPLPGRILLPTLPQFAGH